MLILDCVFEKSAPKVSDAPRGDLPEVCFVGRSNVGKSSAVNTLVRRHKIARVSRTPGRTQLLNFFRVDIARGSGAKAERASLRFCDLPGYGFARAPGPERAAWGKMITAYLAEREALVAVVMLVDAEVGPQRKDHDMLEFLSGMTRPLLVVGTKADRLSRTRRSSALDKIARELAVPRSAVMAFSSHEDIGHDEVWNALCAAAGLFGRKSDRLLEPARESP